MSSIDIVVDTFDDYKLFEMWLFGLKAPKDDTSVSIFCKENKTTYFYKSDSVYDNYLFVTRSK